MAKITRAEAQEKSASKARAIEVLCKQLQVVLVAEQVITKEGLIKTMVLYNDVEAYDIEEEPNNEQNEKPIINEEETSDLREENA